MRCVDALRAGGFLPCLFLTLFAGEQLLGRQRNRIDGNVEFG